MNEYIFEYIYVMHKIKFKIKIDGICTICKENYEKICIQTIKAVLVCNYC